ncbi:alpha/beta hydrolase [Actinomadura rayongensis]|uniref:Esterase family protein n=1 Tax=Actinomadura rayongensis TaxID=1429076 RepID=A0A6I4WFK7_9ACTN|nr:alpha/beta hydrolase family protein [Actinomadura rayongensis]MXQ66636.1 esterase family protein [Actinomadura rayongensis]
MRCSSRALRRLAGGALSLLLTAGVLPGVARPAAAEQTVPADDGARIKTETWIDSRTVDLTVATPAVGDDEMIRVIVPQGWSRTASRTWPVVYAYQGGNDDYLSWVKGSQISDLASQWGVLVVMPAGGKGGGFSDWWNYGRGGTPKWETFHTTEVLQLLERNYRAGTRRAALGVSSGGQGAIAYAARHRGMFAYAASFSGLLHSSSPPIQWTLMLQGVTFDSDPFAVWGVPGFDDANWKAHDPYELADKLRGTQLYISSGTTGLPGPLDDPSKTPLDSNIYGATGELIVGSTAKDFVARLQRLGIPATTHLYGDGWHNWNYWRRELTTEWPLMMQALGAEKV